MNQRSLSLDERRSALGEAVRASAKIATARDLAQASATQGEVGKHKSVMFNGLASPAMASALASGLCAKICYSRQRGQKQAIKSSAIKLLLYVGSQSS